MAFIGEGGGGGGLFCCYFYMACNYIIKVSFNLMLEPLFENGQVRYYARWATLHSCAKNINIQ